MSKSPELVQESKSNKKYHLITFGCQMNEYDSNLIAQQLEDNNAEACDKVEDADIVVVNTCSVREKAEDTAYKSLAQLAALKKKKPDMQIAVVGCMAKNKGKQITGDLSHVDYVLGPDNYKDIDGLFFGSDAAKARQKRLEKSYQVITDFDEVENYTGKQAKLATPYSTFITIQRGCNKRCTYCIVPFVRGNEKYRPSNEVIDEVKMAVDKGVKEITLLGQTVNSYHYEADTFASLLAKVSDISGVERIRFTSPHPKHFTDDLIWLMGNKSNICHHAHIPVQSGSTRMLKKMRRQYDRERFLEISEKLRKAHPDFALTTDIIVGFVGEEDQDFEDTLSLVEEVRFDSAFMFAYSPREGTKAFDEVETISHEEKIARLQRLIEVQNKITFEQNQQMIGKVRPILLEKPSHRDPNEWVGKTECFKKVIVPGTHYKVGDMVNAEINDIRGWTLRGKSLEENFGIIS